MSNTIIEYKEATNQLSLREKVGQFFMPAAFINDSESEIQKLENLIRTNRIGGICFFHSRASAATNYEGKKKVIYNADSFNVLKQLIARYQSASVHPLLISIDAEWGLAMRIENTPQYPYSITLGAMNDPDMVYEVAKKIAEDCRVAGIHWNFAPVADINNNPDNPVIGYRSFGSDKLLVAANAIAFFKGMQGVGILSCAKHFPGHGDTATDSHLGLPVIHKTREALLANELYPFQELIAGGIDAVMVGHLSVPALTGGKEISASISKDIIKGTLRSDMGFQGVVVSDALNMHSVSKAYDTKGLLEWKAFDAGNDVLCFAENVPEGIGTILKNASEEEIEESFKRVWRLKQKGINQKPWNSMHLNSPDEVNKIVADKSLTFYKGDEPLLVQFKRDGFAGVSIGNSKDSIFFENINEELSFTYLSESNNKREEVLKATGNFKNIVISVSPPKVKPQNNFDLGNEQMELLKYLIDKHNVLLYLFGNPYFMRLLPVNKVKGLVIAYQNFDCFHEHAAAHFLGKCKAKGKLPVHI
jgi:beta-glucosidase-like glycosyl hydrolase